MRADLSGAVLAGSVWLAAAVLAWPAHHPYAALAVLAAHTVLLLLANITAVPWLGSSRGLR